MARPKTYVNGSSSKLEAWHFNGVDLYKAYLNNVLIFVKSLQIVLPCNPSYSSVNLRSLINSTPNPGGLIDIFITLNPSEASPAACHHPTIYTGDLSGYYVTLINNGSIEAGSYGTPALVLQSPITVVNNGYIYGCGGNGGNGGKGHVGPNHIVYIESWEERGVASGERDNYCWLVEHNNEFRPTWEGRNGGYDSFGVCSFNGPYDNSYMGGTFIKGQHLGGDCLSGHTTIWSIKKKVELIETYYGGAGGAGGSGGAGRYYGHLAGGRNIGSGGAPGGHPEETRGYQGGYGGAGGSWGSAGEHGEQGYGGGASGSSGDLPGESITGLHHLTTESNLNNDGIHVKPIAT